MIRNLLPDELIKKVNIKGNWFEEKDIFDVNEKLNHKFLINMIFKCSLYMGASCFSIELEMKTSRKVVELIYNQF